MSDDNLEGADIWGDADDSSSGDAPGGGGDKSDKPSSNAAKEDEPVLALLENGTALDTLLENGTAEACMMAHERLMDGNLFFAVCGGAAG